MESVYAFNFDKREWITAFISSVATAGTTTVTYTLTGWGFATSAEVNLSFILTNKNNGYVLKLFSNNI